MTRLVVPEKVNVLAVTPPALPLKSKKAVAAVKLVKVMEVVVPLLKPVGSVYLKVDMLVPVG